MRHAGHHAARYAESGHTPPIALLAHAPPLLQACSHPSVLFLRDTALPRAAALGEAEYAFGTYNTEKEVAQSVRNAFVKKVGLPPLRAPSPPCLFCWQWRWRWGPAAADVALVCAPWSPQYNGVWHCFVGRNFGAYYIHEANHHVYFYMGQMAVLLFKTG